ncbi:energy-coupling factor ABC transporter permease [Actinoplanes flavus]|uniref:Energy-coupling factor ABC transporter permease n=1 Tax=Actinoplanes flavus TaxID=2820290 RepID=A0ABS3UUA3_9ACTN|nr:energy-coupling factor ABC transporter permease [Actinoplanes flavus]MBO3742122.1 energy-coupling factor ABC transporter permease [Actinoplanes flavus]
MEASALHVAGGTVGTPVTIAFSVAAVAALGYCAARARPHLDRPSALTAALLAVFLLAAQLINHLLPEVPGHLIGGALAAMLAGPWIGALTVTTVLILDGLLFGDDLSTLGLNVLNLAILGTAAAYLLVAALLRGLPRNPDGLATIALTTAMVSAGAAAAGAGLQYALGGDPPLTGLTGQLVGTQVLIGIGEGLITAAAVVALARFRPALVYAVTGPRPKRTPPAVRAAVADEPESLYRVVRRRGHTAY